MSTLPHVLPERDPRVVLEQSKTWEIATGSNFAAGPSVPKASTSHAQNTRQHLRVHNIILTKQTIHHRHLCWKI